MVIAIKCLRQRWIFIFALLFFACNGSETGTSGIEVDPASSGRTVTLVFLDKTMSLNDESVLSKFQKTVREQLYNLLGEHDHGVFVHFVHAETASAQAIVSQKISAPFLTEKDVEGKGEITIQEMKDERTDKINKQRIDALNDVDASFSLVNTEDTRLQTDLWATLEIMSRTFTGTDARDRKHVIFVSDMEESMKKGNRRDFTKKAPADKAEAESWAQEDLEAIQELYKVQPDVLAGTQVTIYLPKEAAEASQFQTIRYYWEALFDAFNIPDPKVNGIKIGL